MYTVDVREVSMRLTRRRLRDVLRAGGVRVGPAEDGTTATIVEFLDEWGVLPGVPGSGADTAEIKAALFSAGVSWRMGNMILVARDLEEAA
jgi:hypothetical protein